MKEALIGASGQGSSRLLAELTRRGHQVTAIARHPEKSAAGPNVVAKNSDVFDKAGLVTLVKGHGAKGADFLELLRAVTDLDWTFLSPSAMLVHGERTGKFRLGKDQLLTNDKGSSISFEDYAVAALDELEKPAHIRERFMIGTEAKRL